MKILTSITILITIPNVIFSYYGMNVSGLPLAMAWFPAARSLGVMAIAAGILKWKDLF
jgi:magnesium transporter